MRLLPCRIGALAAFLALAACADLPGLGRLRDWADLVVATPVPGLPAGDWMSLPLRAWLGREGIEARAISACLGTDCPSRLAVGVFRATGAEARRLSALLDDPRRLAMEAARPATPSRKGKASPRVIFSSTALEVSGRQGFVASLSRADGSRRVSVAVLTGSGRDPLDLVLAVGESREAVLRVAGEAARAGLP